MNSNNEFNAMIQTYAVKLGFMTEITSVKN